MTTLLDYHGHLIVISDTIRNFESGWRGVVQAIATDGNGDTMLECLGVNWWTGELDDDDRQWHAPNDVVRCDRTTTRIP